MNHPSTLRHSKSHRAASKPSWVMPKITRAISKTEMLDGSVVIEAGNDALKLTAGEAKVVRRLLTEPI